MRSTKTVRARTYPALQSGELERLRAVSLTPPGLRLLGSGEIDSEELQRALAASGDNFDKQARTIPLVRPHSRAHTTNRVFP